MWPDFAILFLPFGWDIVRMRSLDSLNAINSLCLLFISIIGVKICNKVGIKEANKAISTHCG